jgi:hypothetical protein
MTVGGAAGRRFRAAPVALALLAGLALRVALALLVPPNYDQASWAEAAAIAARGGNLYLETERYNYAPVWGQLLGGLGRMARAGDLPLFVVVRLFLTLCDLVNAFLVARLAAGAGAAFPTGALLLYWLSPVSVLLASVHGQFETLAALPLLFASALLLRAERRPPLLLLWALATLALVTKHLLVFSVLVFFAYLAATAGGALLLFALSAGAFAFSFVPYLPEGLSGIVRGVLLYRSYPEPYSPFTAMPLAAALPLFLVAMAGVPALARRRGLSLQPALELSAVALVVFIPGIGEQYFLLPVLFGASRRRGGWWLFSAAATLFLLGSPHNVHLFDLAWRWPLVWAAAALWLAGLLYEELRAPS